ncbi:MAG TPA: hypothetical protein VL221_07710 [Bacteroidota bacterium]|nr:hypothetical protein [Bacteroidota bacterium]
MNIKGVEGDFSPIDPLKGKKDSSGAKQASASKDRVQVSGRARTLFEADQAARLDEIRKRLESGYYNSQDVTEKVVDGIMDDLLKGA